MSRKDELNKKARARERSNVRVRLEDLDDVFDSLEEAPEIPEEEEEVPAPELPIGFDDEDDEDDEDETFSRRSGSAEFIALQDELLAIRVARQRLSEDLEEPELDKDERDTLKARSMLLDARERSAREELKLFHKGELSRLGQIRKVRIVVESYLQGQEDVYKGKL